MAATGGKRERQGDHFGSESLVDSSRRADPGGIEGRRCARGRKGGRLVQEGGAPQGRFPVPAHGMIGEKAGGGARRNGRFPPPAVNRKVMKRYVLEPMP